MAVTPYKNGDSVTAFVISPGGWTQIPDSPKIAKDAVTADLVQRYNQIETNHYSIAQDAVTAAGTVTAERYNRYTGDYDPKALFGELAWIISENPDTEKYVNDFLDVFEYLRETGKLRKNEIVQLLFSMEKDGYSVDWDACKPIAPIQKLPWTLQAKIRILKWLKRRLD